MKKWLKWNAGYIYCLDGLMYLLIFNSCHSEEYIGSSRKADGLLVLFLGFLWPFYIFNLLLVSCYYILAQQ